MQCGTGVTMARDGVVAEWLRWVVLIASGSLDRPGGMHFHRGLIRPVRRRDPSRPKRVAPGPRSRPELPRVVGQVPAVALVDEIEAGNIRALVVTGGNPLTAFPQPDRLRAALAALDVLAVVDVAENALTALATHVLPATGQLERADVTLAEATALEARVQATRPVVEAGADRKPVWWMFAALNRAMGREPVSGDDPVSAGELDRTDEQFLRGVLQHSTLDADDVFAAGPHGVSTPITYGWVHDELLPGGMWRIAPVQLVERLETYADPEPAAFVLAPRREMAWSNSIAYGAAPAGAVVRMNPADIDTTSVALETDHGAVTALVAVDPTVRAGVVSITHGHLDENPGELTSERVAVDALTAMPRAAGLDVRVTPLAADDDA
jgi:anaerobic selenocysteine-containing dehydrogenase